MSTPAIRQPRPTVSSTAVAPKTFQLSDIVSKSKPSSSRYGIYAKAGFGKTSLGTFFPKPVFLMTQGETGLLTLMEYGQVPETPHFPEIQTWPDLLAALRTLQTETHDYKTLVIDTINGAEFMMHRFVCERDYKNDWTESGFMGYKRGYDTAIADWKLFLSDIDRLVSEKGMTPVFLMHARIKTFKNPSGADYDKYVPELHDKTWAVTQGWLNCLLFGGYEVTVADAKGRVADQGKKGKAAESSTRLLYTNSDNPTFDAKNQMGLPSEIDLGNSAKEGFKNFADALRAARKPEEKEATDGK